MKSVFIDNLWHPVLPSAQFTSLPSPIQYNVPRRGIRIFNKNGRNTLFLNAASPPTSKEEKLVEIPQTSNTQTVSAPYTQVLESLSTLDKSLSQKLDKLKEMGALEFLNDQLKQQEGQHSHETVSSPENTEMIGANVIKSTEVKSAPVKRKKNDIVSIQDHELKTKKKSKDKKT